MKKILLSLFVLSILVPTLTLASPISLTTTNSSAASSKNKVVKKTPTKTTQKTNTSLVAGCTSTAGYSVTTGASCNGSMIQPSIPNLPAGCTSKSGFSITTGALCTPPPFYTPPTQPQPIIVNTPPSNSTYQAPAPVKNGYQICSEQFPNGTWDGTYASDGKYNCVCQSGYTSNSAGTACQLAPNKPQNQQQIFQLQLQYNQLQSANVMLDAQGSAYASYSMMKNASLEQLQSFITSAGFAATAAADQRMVNIILQQRANTEQMNLIQGQINALQN